MVHVSPLGAAEMGLSDRLPCELRAAFGADERGWRFLGVSRSGRDARYGRKFSTSMMSELLEST